MSRFFSLKGLQKKPFSVPDCPEQAKERVSFLQAEDSPRIFLSVRWESLDGLWPERRKSGGFLIRQGRKPL
jgi:hypothetical protein